VGNLNKSSITNSYSTANVTAENERAGGIAGNAVISSITKSYSTGIITATGYGDAGGIAGAIDNGDELTACAAINPSVSGTINAGRIVGSNYGVISSSYARSDMLVNGSPVSSNDATSTHGADQNAGWFEVQGNYEAMGWDFTDVWTMDTNISNYPVLKWQE
jgi:hypothetical protein